MKRRNFLKASGAMSLPFFVGGKPFTAVGKNQLFDLIGEGNDKVLVLVQLQGGNDGLTTILPRDQYDNLAEVRSNVLVPESSIINLTDTIGLHPEMTGLKNIWDDSKLGILQGVAYPNQNRSHFRSTDIWHTASEPDEFLTTGWMGRYFDLNHSEFPDGYPNGNCPDPFALSIGTIISETCQGTMSNFSLAVSDPFDPGSVNLGEEGDVQNNCYGRELGFIRDIARQTNAYSDTIKAAANAGNNISNKYDDNSNFAQKLKTVARLVAGGLETKIYVVQLGGFDLHSGQVVNNNPSQGRQAELLKELSDGLCAFQEDLVQLGVDDRVMGMTYSEFGRRIRSNESNGTDHGTAAPIIVFGSCVNPGIFGDNPVIDTQVGINEGVPMQYDFRSVYATMLMDWFGISEDKVRSVLFSDFQHLPLIQCTPVTSTDNIIEEDISLQVFPNPFSDYFNVKFEAKADTYRISIYNAIGSELKVITNQKFQKGVHELKIPSHDLTSGIYFVRVAGKNVQKTVRVVKSR